MAFAVTARHAGQINPGQTVTTDSVTPTASSLLLLFSGAENNGHSTAAAWQAPSGGSLSYTSIATAGPFNWDGSVDFQLGAASWRAAVGGSPSAHTITTDAYSGTNEANYNAIALDITGHHATTPVTQSKTAGASVTAGNAVSGSVTLDATPATGSLVVVYCTAGNDQNGSFTAPTIGGQAMTQLHNQSNLFCHGGAWYRVITGAESNATITCSDMGESVGNWAMIAVEIAAEAGGGTNYDKTQTDNADLTDTVATVLEVPTVHFLRNTQTEGGTGGTVYDLSTTQGTGATLTTAAESGTTFVEKLRWQKTVGDAVTGTSFPTKVDVASVSASTLEYRWRVQRINSSGVVQASSAYSAAYNTAGIKTETLVLSTTWAAGDRLALAIEVRRVTGGGSRSITVNVNDADSCVAALLGAITRTVTDTAGLTDSASAVTAADRAQTDSVGATDSIATQADVAVTIADSLGSTDTASGSTSGDMSDTLTDPAGLTDAAVAVLAASRDQVDTAGLTDSIVTARQVFAVLVDPLGMIDDDAQVNDIEEDLTDQLGITDTAAGQITTGGTNYDKTVTDPAGLTDNTATVLAADRTKADTIGATDQAAAAIDRASVQLENLGLTDNVAVTRQAFAEIVDGLGLTDTSSSSVDAANERTVTDTAGIADNTTATSAVERSTSDTVGITDLVSVDQARDAADSAGLTDDIATVRQIFAEITDGLGLADATQVQLASSGSQTVADPIGLTDASGATIAGEREQVDAVGVTDQAATVRQVFAEIVDGLGMTDARDIGAPPPPPVVPGVLTLVAISTPTSLRAVEAPPTLTALED